LTRRGSLPLEFDVVPGVWLPECFPDYENFRSQAWADRQQQRSAEKRDTETDGPIWHVTRIDRLPSGEGLKLTVQRATFADVIATAQEQILHQKHRGAMVQDWLACNWRPRDPSVPFYSAANQLMVLLMVITRDNKLVLARQSSSGLAVPRVWANSVVGHVNAYRDIQSDCNRQMLPSPFDAANREASEEIGLTITPDDIEWMALIVGLRLGSYSLYGEVRPKLTAEQIEREYFPNRGCLNKISKISFIEFTPAAIAKRLQTRDLTNLCKLGLALCLWRCGQAEILCPQETDEWAYLR